MSIKKFKLALVFVAILFGNVSKIYAQTPLEIVSIEDASHTAVMSGDWSELETWGRER